MNLFRTRSCSVLLMGMSLSTALTRLLSLWMVNLSHLFPLAIVTMRMVDIGRQKDGQDEGGEGGDVEAFYVCLNFTLISSVLVNCAEGLPNFYVCVKSALKLARFKCYV
jgi:hypothetical protein